jgi:hypothetical protein
VGTLNEEMRRVVEEQRLGYAATVCPDGTPNLSPKGTTAFWDADRLIFARFCRFVSERDFYRYAEVNLRCAFPTLPDRSQFNRLSRSHTELMEAFALHLAALLETQEECPYEALDSSAMPIGDAKRRGSGWLAGYAYTSAGPTAWDGTRVLACSQQWIAPE